ncbi:alpha/beta hydrolase [Brumimicrobium mesophilum]|uniref:alpha/beta hydrolase n=1 Tax=Brumimicrobium mesophilum TaxID=392717 RepID=UPI000D140533|nr:alpha/beta hydrolase [Brumimicrobium mesophilum]
MKNLQIFCVIGSLFVLTACRKRLDSFLFNNDNSIIEYKLDSYGGELALDIPIDYLVPNNDIHLFEYQIEDEGEDLNISAIFVGDLNKISSDTVILYCHGNKDHMDHYWPRQKLLSHLGEQGRFGVLMFDYPGYGLSEGEPTEQNMYESTNGAMKWLKNNGLSDDRLVIYGYSLGSAPATKSVGDQSFVLSPSKLILEAPFASSSVMVQDASILNMPASYFVNTKIENAEQIKKCEVPFYWLHGINDDFLSIESHGRTVYKNHSESWKQKNEVPGANHSDVPTFMGLEVYSDSILSFITK